MKKIVIAFLVCFASVQAFAQYKIDVKINGLKDTTLLLGYHYGAKKLVTDTTRVDAHGHGVFDGKKSLEGGLYMVLTPDYRYFEFMIDDTVHQTFKFETDTANLIENLKVKGSESNQVFIDYQAKSAEIYKIRKPAIDAYKALRDADTSKYNKKQLAARTDSLELLKNRIDSVVTAMLEYENDIIKKHPSFLLSSILNCTHEVDAPDYPRNEKGEITDSLFRYKYIKNHYFDNVNLGDKRLLRTPLFEPKIDDYFDKQLFQIPDSISPQVDFVLKKILEQEGKGVEGDIYYNTLHHLFMKYQNPTYMGLDNIFVYIIKNYYLTNQIPARVVADTAFMNKVKDRYTKLEHNQIGVPAKDMLVYKMGQDTLDNNFNWTRLSDVKSPIVVVYFFDTDCGHCKKLIPEWHKLYRENDLKRKGVETFLVYTQTDMEKWKQFIAEQDMFDFINVFDPYQNTNFRTFYDIYSTPVSYVLNRERKIVAKRLPPETLIDVIEHELKKVKK